MGPSWHQEISCITAVHAAGGSRVWAAPGTTRDTRPRSGGRGAREATCPPASMAGPRPPDTCPPATARPRAGAGRRLGTAAARTRCPTRSTSGDTDTATATSPGPSCHHLTLSTMHQFLPHPICSCKTPLIFTHQMTVWFSGCNGPVLVDWSVA